ncbi:MAG: electron transfer flavoprotein subunit alpha/FixB family protein [Nonlabens sp.]
MSVLVYTESENGKFKKTAYEVASYARGIADMMGTDVAAISFNASDAGDLGLHGVSRLHNVTDSSMEKFNAAGYASAIAQAAKAENASVVVISSSADSKYLGALLSVNMEAGYVTNVTELPSSTDPFTVKRHVFTNKAYANTSINTSVKLLGLSKNAYGLKENPTDCAVQEFAPSIDSSDLKVSVESVDKATDKVTIADAEVVVSAGRGMKGPENWGMIEELADVLGAATACSKPVSDMGWRPHGEHVGQTGKPVASNLYIAIGISGAIQHLAGINSSKIKVVINTDSEAPFFKAADYGVVGDAFEVLPTLIEKLKAFKAANA